MIDAGVGRRPVLLGARDAAAAIAVAALVLLGYLGISDVRVSAVAIGAIALAVWALFAFERPRLALPWSFFLVLLAGTKFRVRDATASLDGALDAQVAMELAVFAMVGIGAVAAWLAAADRRPVTSGEKAIAAYVGIALLSVAWSESPMLTLVRAGQLAVLALMAVVAVRVLTPGRALWAGSVAVSLHVLAFSAMALLLPDAYGIADSERPGRFSWFAVHPIEVGTLAAIGALGLLSAALFIPRAQRPRLLGMPVWLLIVPLVGVLLLANTRGALLAFVAAAGLLVFLRMHGTLRWPLALVGAAAVPLFVVFGPDFELWLHSLATDYPAMDSLFFRGQGVETVLEMNGRLQLWDDLRPAIVEQLMGGYGYLASRPVLLDAAYWAAYAHNAVLQSLLDLGVVGTVALLAVVGVSLSAARRTDLGSWLRPAVTTIAVFLVVNSISTESFAGAPGFDALVLFLCAACAAWRPQAPVAA